MSGSRRRSRSRVSAAEPAAPDIASSSCVNCRERSAEVQEVQLTRALSAPGAESVTGSLYGAGVTGAVGPTGKCCGITQRDTPLLEAARRVEEPVISDDLPNEIQSRGAIWQNASECSSA
jgi:hypothetical protein